MAKGIYEFILSPATIILAGFSGLLAYWGMDYINQPELVIFGNARAEIGVLKDGVWTGTGEGLIGEANTIRFPYIRRNPDYASATWILTRNLYGQCGNTEIEQLRAPERSTNGYEVYVRFEIPAVFQAGDCCYITTAEVYNNPLHRFFGPLKARSPEICFKAVEPPETLAEDLRIDNLKVETLKIIQDDGEQK